jgi:very-short-patch-repair endonuclease
MFKCEVCQKEFSNKGGCVTHERTCKKVFPYREEIKKLYNDDLLCIKQIAKKFGVGNIIVSNVLGENVRTPSEGAIIGHKKYPNSFKHSNETKDVLREKRLEFMKNNPEKTSWRQKNISYPEKLFLNKINEIGWSEKYSIVREFSVFPFFIDFAFVNEMVAVEIDGSQHLLEERKKKDQIKDEVLNKQGWCVIRISEREIKKNIDETIEKLEVILLSSIMEKKYEFGVVQSPKLTLEKKRKYEFGVIKLPKLSIKKERLINGLTEGELNRMVKGRKVERPPYTELIKSVEEIGYLATGKKYGVSDNAIRKWLRFYLKYEK